MAMKRCQIVATVDARAQLWRCVFVSFIVLQSMTYETDFVVSYFCQIDSILRFTRFCRTKTNKIRHVKRKFKKKKYDIVSKICVA